MNKNAGGRRGGCLIVPLLTLLITGSMLIYLITSFYPTKYSEIVEKNALANGLQPSLVYAVIKAESGYKEKALSRKGAKGLMQIMDSTGKWCFVELREDDFSPDMLFEPEINIEIGCWYLGKLIEQYKSADIALAAYNAGSGNVSGWLKNPDYFDGTELYSIPFEETRNYVRKVNANKAVYEIIRGVLSKFEGVDIKRLI